MRGCCVVCCRSGVQNCKAGCEGVVSLNDRTSIAHHDGFSTGTWHLAVRCCTSGTTLASLYQPQFLGLPMNRDDFVGLKYSPNWRDYDNPSAPLSVL